VTDTERSRLKNIIILILALVNVFLLVSLSTRLLQQRSADSRSSSELVRLFQEAGITLDGDAIPTDTPPAARTLTRDTAADEKVGAFFLGSDLDTTDEGGGIFTCTSDRGSASFRSGGSFDITGRLAGDDPLDACRKFCKRFGYGELTFSISGSGGSAAAVQYYDGYPVVNCTVTFQVENNALVSVSGTHLPDARTPDGAAASMTAATALTRFLDARRESGQVVSAVTGVSLCYELQSTTAAPMTLAPAWRIATDTGTYLVNCASGAVSRV